MIVETFLSYSQVEDYKVNVVILHFDFMQKNQNVTCSIFLTTCILRMIPKLFEYNYEINSIWSKIKLQSRKSYARFFYRRTHICQDKFSSVLKINKLKRLKFSCHAKKIKNSFRKKFLCFQSFPKMSERCSILSRNHQQRESQK